MHWAIQVWAIFFPGSKYVGYMEYNLLFSTGDYFWSTNIFLFCRVSCCHQYLNSLLPFFFLFDIFIHIFFFCLKGMIFKKFIYFGEGGGGGEEVAIY